jgi:hypothetical protein
MSSDKALVPGSVQGDMFGWSQAAIKYKSKGELSKSNKNMFKTQIMCRLTAQ